MVNPEENFAQVERYIEEAAAFTGRCDRTP